MKNLFEKIRDFFGELIQFIKRIMGPDLSEYELYESEYNNDYFYQKENGFSQLENKNKKILDEAMNDVVYEESNMSIESALKMAKKSKLATKKNETKTNSPANPNINKDNKKEEMSREEKSADRDI